VTGRAASRRVASVEHRRFATTQEGNDGEPFDPCGNLLLLASPTIRNCTFAHNDCDGLGGALFTDNRASRVGATGTRVADSIFRRNSAGIYGGAAADYNEVSSTYAGCRFERNTAVVSGGAVATLYDSTQV